MYRLPYTALSHSLTFSQEAPIKKPQSKRTQHFDKSCQPNGDPLSPHALLYPTPTISVIVEVDDPDNAKSNK